MILLKYFNIFVVDLGNMTKSWYSLFITSNLTDRRQSKNGASLDVKKLLRSKLVTYGHIISLAVKYIICLYAVFSEFRSSIFFFIYSEMPLWLFDIQEPGLTGKYHLSSV